MHMFAIVFMCASLLFACQASQKIGSKCKRTGTCVEKDSCPNDVIGKCCAGLDCCNCPGKGSACGTTNQGQCISADICPSTTVPVIGPFDCCPGYICCEECRDKFADCGTTGLCDDINNVDSCTQFDLQQNCCSGYVCCGDQ